MKKPMNMDTFLFRMCVLLMLTVGICLGAIFTIGKKLNELERFTKYKLQVILNDVDELNKQIDKCATTDQVAKIEIQNYIEVAKAIDTIMFERHVVGSKNNTITDKPQPPKTVEMVVPPEYQRGVRYVRENKHIVNMIRNVCDKYDNRVDPYIVMAQVYYESEYTPKHKTGDCLGLMQISKKWHTDRAKKLGVTDFLDPESNILLGVDFMNEQLAYTNDIVYTLLRYNMRWDTAAEYYKQGKRSKYVNDVLGLAEVLKAKGE